MKSKSTAKDQARKTQEAQVRSPFLFVFLFFPNLRFFISITRNSHLNRGFKFALERMDGLDDETFKRMFRMNRSTFASLVDELTPLIYRSETKANNSSGTPISVKTRLACFFLHRVHDD